MRTLLCLLLGLSGLIGNGQIPTCGTSQLQSDLFNRDHGILQRHLQIEQNLYTDFNAGYSNNSRATYTLPVVVHVIHNNGAENISDAQVASAIQYINNAFANTGYFDPNTGVSTTIQFCLAKQDPQGTISNGINHIQSPLTNLTLETDDINMKNLSRWNPLCYVNIWVVKEICSNSSGCGVAGYAYFPSASGTAVDGLVVESRYFGTTPGNTTVAVHELGHYLGLYHTFEGGCNNSNCLADGDKVCDTPPDQSTAAVACSGSTNSCSTDALSGFTSDQSDLTRDYMDYGNPACFNMFTAGQRDRMYWHLDNVRNGLLTCPSCNNPCASNIAAMFTPSASNTTVGTSVTFNNASTGAATYKWFMNGTQFSTAAQPQYTFTAEGSYIIQLKTVGIDSNCIDYFTDTISVVCGTLANFIQPQGAANVGQSLTFTNTSTGATTYQWLVDGVVQSTSTNFTYTFNQQGTYAVYLIATGPQCSDTTSIINFIHVGSPCNVSYTTYPIQPTTCLGVNFLPDTTCRYSNYLWTFCDPDYANAFHSEIDTPSSSIGSPCGTALYRDDVGNYYGFSVNYSANSSPHLYRFDYGTSMSNNPIVNAVTTTGVGGLSQAHGFDIIKEGSTYYGFLLFNAKIFRLNFGTSLTNTTPTVTQITGISGISWGHKIQAVKQYNNYWLITVARSSNTLTLLYLGNSITNNVQTVISQPCSSCSGFDYHIVNGNHYVYATSLFNGVKCFRFGNSLTNTPTTSGWQFFNQGYHDDLALYQNCDGSFDGVILKEDQANHHVLVHLNNADDTFHLVRVLSTPLGRTANISKLIRTDEGITCLAALSTQSSLGKISFGDCGIPYSTQKFPPTVYYNDSGSYYVRLAVDEGLPTQQVYCNTIHVANAPGIPLNLGPDKSICDNPAYTLHAGPGYTSYLWYNGTTDSNNTVYASGIYYVRVTDNCGNTYSDTIRLRIDTSTAIIITGDTVICHGETTQLTVTSSLPSYSWEPTLGVSCAGCATTNVTPITTTTYTVTGKSSGVCANSASVTVTVQECTDVNNLQVFKQFEITPVPAHGSIQLRVTTDADKLQLTIYNALGQQVLKNDVALQLNTENVFNMNVSNLAPGIYYLDAQTPNRRQTAKLVIE